MKTFKSNRGGFTLIELLVVIAIISLLSSVVLATVNDARKKAQYAKFDQDFLQLRTAIELYRADNSGEYPNILTNRESFQNFVSGLYEQGYYSADSISIPPGYFPNNDEAIDFIEQSSEFSVTCGSPLPSGSWVLYFNTDAGLNSTKLPQLYINNGFFNVPVSDYYCIEV